MRKGGSKSKGNSFERFVCKSLSLWITNGKKADCLWRSAISGGRATVARKRGELVRQAGDICSVSPEGHSLTDVYYIECKSYKDLRLDSFVFGKGPLAKFWKETIAQANHYQKKPMLIAKSNNVPILVLTRDITTSGRLGVFVDMTFGIKPLAIIGNAAVRRFDDVLKTEYKP